MRACLWSAAAQQNIEDVDDEWDEAAPIIVTATKRATTLQYVPFSINAQTQQDIRRSGANSIEDIARNVAGLTVQNLGPGFRTNQPRTYGLTVRQSF